MAAKNRKKKKKLTFEEEHDLWREKMRELARREPIPPAMKRAADQRWAETKKYLAARNKKPLTLYDADTDYKQVIHEHWDKKYGGSIPGH